ncbi:hypothetical protein CK203_023823 [Vitis vinifera]|uniref:Uncharacterized protein n=1 Tax=Vitis vinifera TaxID=29760 RepID=A0A438JAJ0_VITVI|nr:hypothetical protein CK203_023823 [Vitis vinifera]
MGKVTGMKHGHRKAIEAAIELNLNKVEAGAQGEHKIQRGYMPVTTYSCHYFLDKGFEKAINEFLVRETAQVKLVMKLLHESGPFKDGFTMDLPGQVSEFMSKALMKLHMI